jgi:succinate dehydrogenase / fumarate reductase, cytochrome b subunit
MAEAVKKPKPEFRNIGIGQILTAYRPPLAGRVSILHLVSGGLLFIFLPFLLYLFEQSLTSPLSFAAFKAFLANIIMKLITLVLAWAFLLPSARVPSGALTLMFDSRPDCFIRTAW